MTNKDKKDARDPALKVGGEDHEVRSFADAVSISYEETRDLIDRFGTDRETLTREAKKIKATAKA